MYILENSLYTNQQEKEELLKDKEKVASAFFINFLGTLGLFSISSSRGIMKTYFPDDKKVQLVNIGDANKDTSLSVKLYSDIGGLKPDVANKITRLLFKLKSRAITSKNLDENSVREIVGGIQYLSHRPHPLILNIVKQFESGNANLKQVGKAFYQLVKTRKKDFLPISQEFYSIAKQYLVYFKNIPDIGTLPPNEVSSPDITQISQNAKDYSNSNFEIFNQNSKVKKDQALRDEDFYLSLWKATSRNEIEKLLKKRGYDSFAPELIDSACNYLLPKQKNAYFDSIITAMPKIDTFIKAFGSFIKEKYEEKLQLALLYKISLSEKFDEIKQGLEKSKTFIEKLFRSNKDSTLNGRTKYSLRKEIDVSVEKYYHNKIINSKPSENVDSLFSSFLKDLDFLAKIFNASFLTSIIPEIEDNTSLSDKEKIKYLIAYLSSPVVDLESKAVKQLIALLEKNNIYYESNNNKDMVFIPKYDNLFPNSKEYIDNWFKQVNSKFISFGSKNIYSIIARSWNDDLSKEIESNENQIPQTESEEQIARNIIAEIDKLVTSKKDRGNLFEKIAANPYFGLQPSSKRAMKISSFVQIFLALRFKEEFQRGQVNFNIDEHNIKNYILDMIEMVLTNFKKMDSAINDNQWNAYASLIEALFKNNENFQKELFHFLVKNYFQANIIKILDYFSIWPLAVRTIIDERMFNSSGARKIISDQKATPYLTNADFNIIKENMLFEDFIIFCFEHKKNILEFVDYNEFEEYVRTVIVNVAVFLSEEKLEYIKKAIVFLKEENRKNIFDAVIKKAFTIDASGIWQLKNEYLTIMKTLGFERELFEFLNSSEPDQKRLTALQVPELFFEYMTADNINSTLAHILKPGTSYENYFGSSFIKEALNHNEKISLENAKKIAERFSGIKFKENNPYNKFHEEELTLSFALLRKKSEVEAEKLFSSLSPKERKIIVNYFIKHDFIEDSLRRIQGDGVVIKPLQEIDDNRLLEILKYNEIEIPTVSSVRKTDTLVGLLSNKANISPLKDLHVEQEILSEEELERMSIEYDIFNRYKHGDIAVKFIKSFNVYIPIQDEGFKGWLDKMDQEGIDPKIMKPVFHGTGSIGASMILRYGFKVIKANDPLVVGRMMGDGIYFSNVLDKVAQYIGDEGYSRKIGTQGYIFEMEASLGKNGRDYKSAGTGSLDDYITNVVSPEWVVYNPNEQLRIYKAYLVELMNEREMKSLKKKYNVNESTGIFEIKSFKQFINEGVGDMKNCITYIFMDGTIPTSEKDVVEFEKFVAKKFGKHVKLDWTGSGPAVMIYNNKESKTFVVRYTEEFMRNKKELEKYLKLLRK